MKINLHNLAASIRTLLGNVQTHLTDNSKHITADERTSWNNKTNDSKIASATELGHVKVGENLTIGTDGNLSAATEHLATKEELENIALTPGPAGPQGPKGDKGETGPQGPAGTSADIPTATTSRAGIVQLSNSLSSTSETTAVTSKAMKDVVDSLVALDTRVVGKANAAQPGETYLPVTGTYFNQGGVYYFKSTTNIVYVQFDIISTAPQYIDSMFTLPVGYRPSRTIRFLAGSVAANGTSSTVTPVECTISTFGTVMNAMSHQGRLFGQFSFRV